MKWTVENVKEFRAQLGLSQSEFGKLLGVETRSVSRWENGTSRPTGSADAILSGLKEKIEKDPGSFAQIRDLISGSVGVGGLAYLIVKMLDMITKEEKW
ncbi:MAG: helix-turn-helix domain-containing protein [Pseudomonadota bacterium]